MIKVGYVTGYSPEEARWAADVGFDTLELWALEGAKKDWKKAAKVCQEQQIEVNSVFHMADYGSTDAKESKAAIKGAEQAMEQCVILGASVLSCNGFCGRGGTVGDKVKRFTKAIRPLVKKANDLGLKIAVENCPHGDHNIMSSPANWERCFNEIDDPAFGLEFDPSHLVWMGVDYLAALRKFASRVHSFHAKDTEVRDDILAVEGILGEGWWRYRMPGWGEVDWQEVVTILWENNYQGSIIIEHEDPVFHGDRHREGLIRGLDFLIELVDESSLGC